MLFHHIHEPQAPLKGKGLSRVCVGWNQQAQPIWSPHFTDQETEDQKADPISEFTDVLHMKGNRLEPVRHRMTGVEDSMSLSKLVSSSLITSVRTRIQTFANNLLRERIPLCQMLIQSFKKKIPKKHSHNEFMCWGKEDFR